MAGSIPRREHVMRHALSDARRTLGNRAASTRSCEDDMAEIGRAIANDAVSGAMAASERAEHAETFGDVDGARPGLGLPAQVLPADMGAQNLHEGDLPEGDTRKRRRSRTVTVDDIRRELSRREDDDP